jgi:4-diphosphocytidyl-2C-methyl-D-erythritol kinase
MSMPASNSNWTTYLNEIRLGDKLDFQEIAQQGVSVDHYFNNNVKMNSNKIYISTKMFDLLKLHKIRVNCSISLTKSN